MVVGGGGTEDNIPLRSSRPPLSRPRRQPFLGGFTNASLLPPSSSFSAAPSSSLPSLPSASHLMDSDKPEFSKVYAFLGSLFDPASTDHAAELDKMTPLNRNIVQQLMQNLAANLPNNNNNINNMHTNNSSMSSGGSGGNMGSSVSSSLPLSASLSPVLSHSGPSSYLSLPRSISASSLSSLPLGSGASLGGIGGLSVSVPSFSSFNHNIHSPLPLSLDTSTSLLGDNTPTH